jgi:hypothetical protein
MRFTSTRSDNLVIEQQRFSRRLGGYPVQGRSCGQHKDVFGDKDEIKAFHFSDNDYAVGSVGGVQVNVVGTDSSVNDLFVEGQVLTCVW